MGSIHPLSSLLDNRHDYSSQSPMTTSSLFLLLHPFFSPSSTMIYPLLFFSLLTLPITTVLSQQTGYYDSGEIDHNNTTMNKEEDKVVVYYFQPPKEWMKLKAILLISAAAGSLAFLALCFICGMRAACSPFDRRRRKYLSHA